MVWWVGGKWKPILVYSSGPTFELELELELELESDLTCPDLDLDLDLEWYLEWDLELEKNITRATFRISVLWPSVTVEPGL